MRVIERVPLGLIDPDRLPPPMKTVGLVYHMVNGGAIPPVHLQPTPTGRFRVMDGRHRIRASLMLGRETVLAKYAVSA